MSAVAVPGAARLSVNLNKIALLRNARDTGTPALARFVPLARDAGAGGITIHPRPDERHIRGSDVAALAAQIAPWRPGFELNIEGFPDERLFALIRAVRPEQCTLVPDDPAQATSDHGWPLDRDDLAPVLQRALAVLAEAGSRAVLFVDADPALPARAAALGAAGIEIYTGPYARAVRDGDPGAALDAARRTGEAAAALGLLVNAGHDLDLDNLPALVSALPMLHEASIGHALAADALESGFARAVAAYVGKLQGGRCKGSALDPLGP